MIYVLLPDDPLPAQVAKALQDYYAKHGKPPAVTESIEVEVVDERIEIKEFSVGETE